VFWLGQNACFTPANQGMMNTKARGISIIRTLFGGKYPARISQISLP